MVKIFRGIKTRKQMNKLVDKIRKEAFKEVLKQIPNCSSKCPYPFETILMNLKKWLKKR